MFELGRIFERKNSHAYGAVPGPGIDQAGNAAGGGGISLLRKVPVKIEPKVYFANERTFLAWMHMAVLLSSISVAIVAFAEANAWSQIYGLILMPTAISFCCYALFMYVKRSRMIRRKDPGPYEEKWGPVVLSTILAASIVTNFFVKLYEVNTRR